MKVLAIETSCDETAAAVVDYTDGVFAVLSNIVSSQVALHAQYGGVVPNLAAREHEKNIIPVISETLTAVHANHDNIDLIAVTHGPGLIPALVVGVSAAKTLAYVWRKPLIGVHHIEGHIYANALSLPGGTRDMRFPLIALVVSGGHTQLILMRDHLTYEIIGQTLDDAVGEAFDKAARMLGLPYPGGPAISQSALKYLKNRTNESVAQCPARPSADTALGVPQGCSGEDRASRRWSGERVKQDTTPREQNPMIKPLPRPMLHSKDYNFSFSGIKTAVLYRVKDFRTAHSLADDASLPEDFVNAMSYEFQEAVTEVLIKKTLRAVAEHDAQMVTIAGGVSANTRLRARLGDALAEHHPSVTYVIPQFDYCLDNAAMIAAAAAVRYEHMTNDERTAAQSAYRTLDAAANRKITD